MSLLSSFMKPCCFVEGKRIKDGAGGYITVWEDGEVFDAAITLDTTMEARIASKQGVTSVYTVTTIKGVPLAYNDKIKRLEDGRMFRITSDPTDKTSPAGSTINAQQMSAERWEKTT